MATITLPNDQVKEALDACVPALLRLSNYQLDPTLAQRMNDIIDVDTGAIISGEATIAQMGETILDYVIQVASGEVKTKAELKGQSDFIPWKRGVSL